MKLNNYFKIFIICALFCLVISCSEKSRHEAFNANLAWQELKDVLEQNYAYLDRPGLDEKQLFDTFKPTLLNTDSPQEFADVGQQLVRHFHDPHLNLGPYNESDYSVFPTGSDIRAVYDDGHFIVEDVKADAAADHAGVRPGMNVTSINGVSSEQAVEAVFGRDFEQLSDAQINYGINISLGGLRNQPREVELVSGDNVKTFRLPASYDAINSLSNGPTVTFSRMNEIGFIRFNNSLGNNATVAAFKQALASLLDTKALIIDLRNTPSGGNTSVAEPILGHFVEKKSVYQLYQIQKDSASYEEAPMQSAYVTPTSPRYDKPFVVLAGRWTGSMGEGMTIGLDALGAKTVIGAPMADLLGGIKTVQLEQSNTWLELGFERLYHVDKTFREDFEPHIVVSPTDRDENGADPALSRAIQFIEKINVQSAG